MDVVLLMLVSCEIYNLVGSFKVHNFTSLSDHCTISCSLITRFFVGDNNLLNLAPSIPQFVWNNEALEKYTMNLNSNEFHTKFNEFLSADFTDCNAAVSSFNSIIQEAASKSTKTIKKNQKNFAKKRRKHKPWFNDSCRDLYTSVKNYEKLVNKYPQNENYRTSFYRLRSKFRRACKLEERNFRKQIHTEIYNKMDKDPKSFWSLINKLDKHVKSTSSDEYTCNKEFTDFYKSLYKIDMSTKNVHNEIEKDYKKIADSVVTNMDNSVFNGKITSDEILKAIKTLKNNKSSAEDMIANEMLKNGTNILIKPLVKLFNIIFENGVFPTAWNTSLLVMLHKKGDKHDPMNYRGLSITSNLGKLFNKIIHRRLYDFMEENSLISINQIGFKQKSRTVDHIFTLKSIIDTFKLKRKKVFAAFIDLKKAYDTVWRIGLFYKLLKQKTPNKIFSIIASMYSSTTFRIKFSNGITELFHSERGVKQGDVLSPLLFNFYIDDLVKALNTRETDPVSINGNSLNILLYADDIVILSESKTGLQNSLNILSNFCSTWKLQVNTKKSNIIVFNSNGKAHIDEFTYNGEILKTVKQYCYLGIVMSYNGNFNTAKATLAEKGRKALFKIKKTIGLNNPCILLEKLFDTLVSPILLYGCEVWGINNVKGTDPQEKMHVKFIKEILGVHCKTSNDACRAELARLPLKQTILFSCIKFLNHIQSQNDTLVNKIYQATKSVNPWTKNTVHILQQLGFPFLNDFVNFKPYIRSIKQRIIDQHQQEQNANIYNSTKLSFFKKIHNINQRAKYVDTLANRCDRSQISKVKLSAHQLNIEKGRYSNIPRSDRLCHFCNSCCIENEEHFLLHCSAYVNIRNDFHKKLENLNIKSIHNYNNDIKLQFLFNTNSIHLLKAVSVLIANCFNVRKNLM